MSPTTMATRAKPRAFARPVRPANRKAITPKTPTTRITAS